MLGEYPLSLSFVTDINLHYLNTTSKLTLRERKEKYLILVFSSFHEQTVDNKKVFLFFKNLN